MSNLISPKAVARLAAGSALLLLLAACGGGAGDSNSDDGLTDVAFRTDIYFSGAVLPIIAGAELGIYEKHGLNVEIESGTGSATTIQTVGNGSDDMGYAAAGTLVQSVAKGIPVKMVAGMVQKNPLAIFTFKDSGIDSPKDLEGKLSGFTPGSAAEQMWPAFAEAAGIDESKVEFRNVDIPTRGNLFFAGKTDFTFGLVNTSGPNNRAKCDCELTVFRYSDVGVEGLSSGIIAGNEFAENEPETLKKFLAATQEAVKFTNENLDKAVDAFFAYATQSTLERDVVAEQWKISNSLHETDANKGEPFGCTAKEDWQTTIEMMETYGGMDSGVVSPDDVASNAFLPKTCADSFGASK